MAVRSKTGTASIEHKACLTVVELKELLGLTP
jgi:hypothetical protein